MFIYISRIGRLIYLLLYLFKFKTHNKNVADIKKEGIE